MLDERSTEILKLLVQTDDYVTLDELTQRLGISRRTVYYDMNKINDWLETLELPPVEYVRTAGYSLPEASRRGSRTRQGQRALRPSSIICPSESGLPGSRSGCSRQRVPSLSTD